MEIKIYAQNQSFEIDNQVYKWYGIRTGRLLTSYERSVKVGDTRMIGNLLFYVISKHKDSFFAPEIGWGCNEIVSQDDVKALKQAIFEIDV